MLWSDSVFSNDLHSCALYPVRKQQKYLRKYAKLICMHLVLCASWKLELYARKLVSFVLTNRNLHDVPILGAQIHGEIYISRKHVGGREESWASFSLELLWLELLHPDLQCRWVGQDIHLVSLLSLQNRWGNTSCKSKGCPNHWMTLLALFTDLGCWEGVENGLWDQEGGKNSYPLSNTSDNFSRLGFCIRS